MEAAPVRAATPGASAESSSEPNTWYRGTIVSVPPAAGRAAAGAAK